MASITRIHTSQDNFTMNGMVKAGAITAVVISIINLLILFVAETIFGVTVQFEALNFSSVMLSSVLGAIGGAVAFKLIMQMFPRNSINVFRVVAFLVFLLSLAAPINASINGLPTIEVMTMIVMHMISAGAIVVSLTNLIEDMS